MVDTTGLEDETFHIHDTMWGKGFDKLRLIRELVSDTSGLRRSFRRGASGTMTNKNLIRRQRSGRGWRSSAKRRLSRGILGGTRGHYRVLIEIGSKSIV